MSLDDWLRNMSPEDRDINLQKMAERRVRPKRERAAVEYGASEAEIQQAIIQALLLDGWLVLRINSGGMQMEGRYVVFYYWQVLGSQPVSDGITDLIAFRGERAVFIEVKTDTGPVREGQSEFLVVCAGMGIPAMVARSVEDIRPILVNVEVQ